MFLPAFIELKKPKNGGVSNDRLEIPEINLRIMHFILFAADEQKFDISLIQTLVKIFGALPSLEV